MYVRTKGKGRGQAKCVRLRTRGEGGFKEGGDIKRVRVHKGGSSQLRTIAYNRGGRWNLIFEIFLLTYYVTQ